MRKLDACRLLEERLPLRVAGNEPRPLLRILLLNVPANRTRLVQDEVVVVLLALTRDIFRGIN
jgi:hypothetical protein